MKDQVIAEIAKRGDDVVRVSLTEFNGKSLIDVRVFVPYKATGKIGPTPKGVSLRLDRLPELVAALQKAEQQARAAGLLNGSKGTS
jgi:hypothetical protein